MEHRVADPGPLGLAGFAMTTFLLSIFNIGLFKFGGTASAAASGAITQDAAVTIAAAERSMSSSVVAQFEIDTRTT